MSYDDHRLRRDIRELFAEQARTVASRADNTDQRLSALDDQVTALSGQVEALSDKLDALLGLRQVEVEQNALEPVRTARQAAARMVRAVVDDRPVPTASLDDVDGYWLVPAAQALVGARDGRVDQAAAEVAAARDPLRTATLLVAVLTLVGRPEAALPWLDAAFFPTTGWGSPSGTAGPTQVTVATRAVWDAAASGLLDLAGVQAVQHRLRAVVPASLGKTLLGLAPSTDKHCSQVEALDAWTAWVATTGPALDSPTDGAGAACEALHTVVGSLTDEGAPDERDLMERTARLNAKAGHAPDPSQVWDAPTVSLTNALTAAVRSTAPNQARLVAPAVLPVLRERVDNLVQTLERAPAPTRTVQVDTQSWTVTGDDDLPGLAAALAAARAQTPPGQRLPLLGALTAATVGFVVLAVVVTPIWLAAAALTGIAAIVEYVVRREKAIEHQEAVTTRETRLTTRLREARAQVSTEAANRAVTLTAARALSTALAALPAEPA
ncbi:MAG: hypothetical protein FWH11_04405 [Micrococcales bacterium]|nr:hypothetical protein [Micrococcales bacterium]